jgi:L-arabinokinase
MDAFLETLRTLHAHPTREARDLFDAQGDLTIARAPGRLDVMGGIADYSGSLVLQRPIREAAFVAVQRQRDPSLRIVSLGNAANGRQTASFAMALGEFEEHGQPVSYASARARFRRSPRDHWASYVAGACLVLMRERQATFAGGARLLLDSRVPEGKGVSSSAAIEVAAMQAIAAAFGFAIAPRDLAILCQMVENLVVGAPCGVMDQITAACGEEGRLLSLLCQPAEIQGQVPVPEEIAFWGVDSGVRHSVAGADYGSVRVGAFMGYRILADIAGFSVRDTTTEGCVAIEDPRWGGYLANVTPAEFGLFAPQLPREITGSEFLRRYRGTTDRAARVEPERTYAVRVPAAHPVHEHARVRAFAALLSEPDVGHQLPRLGELMYESHASYSACGLRSDATDLLVELVRSAGPSHGLFGAKITGGGSGGTVAVLGRRDASPAVQAIAEQFAARTGHRPAIFAGSSPGAATFGVAVHRIG